MGHEPCLCVLPPFVSFCIRAGRREAEDQPRFGQARGGVPPVRPSVLGEELP